MRSVVELSVKINSAVAPGIRIINWTESSRPPVNFNYEISMTCLLRSIFIYKSILTPFNVRRCIHLNCFWSIMDWFLPLGLLGHTLTPCFDFLSRSNGHNILTLFVVTCCDHGPVKRPQPWPHNISRTKEMLSQHCCEVWSNGLNIGSQQMLWECCDKCCDRLIRPLDSSKKTWIWIADEMCERMAHL